MVHRAAHGHGRQGGVGYVLRLLDPREAISDVTNRSGTSTLPLDGPTMPLFLDFLKAWQKDCKKTAWMFEC